LGNDSKDIEKISIGDLDALSSALSSLNGIENKPIENREYLEPRLFSEALISYMESNKWERFLDVYSKLIQKQPQFNLKKYGFKSYEYIFLCSEFIETKEKNNEIYIRHFHPNYEKMTTPKGSQVAMKKKNKITIQNSDSGLLKKMFSRIISRRVRFIERNLKKITKDNFNQLIKITNLESDLKKTSEDRILWKNRHDSLKKQMREDRNLPKDSLVTKLREKINTLEMANEEMKNELDAIVVPIDDKIPTSIYDAVKIAKEEYSSLYFFDDSLKSASDSPYLYPERILDALRQMDENAKKWFLMKPGTGSYESLLRGNDGLNVAESDSIKREFGTIDSKGEWRKFEMKAHIKFGVQRNPEKTLRIYYRTDREMQKIFIGWCGKHL